MPPRAADRGGGALSEQHASAGMLDYYGSADGARVLFRHALALAGFALALGAIFSDGRVDVAVAAWFFDGARGVFPLTDDWWLKVVLHDDARTASAVGGLALFAVTCVGWLSRRPSFVRAYRQELLFASAAALIAAATVDVLKHFSSHACPWDLALFGGTAVYQPFLASSAAASSVPGCLPAAHPLAGYAWLGAGFAIYPASRSLARAAWLLAGAAGTLFGAVQVGRGAHFPSHVLWSLWIAWAVNVALLSACALGSVSSVGPRAREPIDNAPPSGSGPPPIPACPDHGTRLSDIGTRERGAARVRRPSSGARAGPTG